VTGTNGPTPSSSPATAIDLHVHTTASSCGYMTPLEVVGHTRAAGRRYLAITDHNTTSGAVEARTFAKATGDDVTVIVGMELSTADFGHVLVFGEGVEDDWGWKSLMPMPRNLPDGWVAIQAHPFRDLVKRALPGPIKFDLPDLPPSISAIERWNGNDLLSKSPDRRADLDEASLSYIAAQGRTAVASSDAHRAVSMHAYHTVFPKPVRSVADIAAQIKSGDAYPGSASEAELAEIRTSWRRRNAIGWHLMGLDWQVISAKKGRDADEAVETIRIYGIAQKMVGLGFGASDLCEETGVTLATAMDFIAIVHEENLDPPRVR
jgi:hypothetical protein